MFQPRVFCFGFSRSLSNFFSLYQEEGQHSSKASGSEEENFNIFLCVSMVQTRNPLGRSILELGISLNKLGLGPQGYARRRFFNIFRYISMLENQDLLGRAVLNPGTFIIPPANCVWRVYCFEIVLPSVLPSATHQIFK